jgi:hypothetical protein
LITSVADKKKKKKQSPKENKTEENQSTSNWFKCPLSNESNLDFLLVSRVKKPSFSYQKTRHQKTEEAFCDCTVCMYTFVGEEAVRYLIPFGESKVCLMKNIGVGPVTKTPDT